MCPIFCVLVGLDWTEPMIYLLCMSHVHAFSMHVYLFSYILIIVNCFGTFLIVSFSLSLLLVTLVMSMAPKRKSTSARNPLHSDASSFFDHAPLSFWFCNDDAYKAFTENFSRRGIHLERRVILGHFANTDLPTNSGVLLHMHGIDRSVLHFFYLCLRYFYSCHTVSCYGCA